MQVAVVRTCKVHLKESGNVVGRGKLQAASGKWQMIVSWSHEDDFEMMVGSHHQSRVGYRSGWE